MTEIPRGAHAALPPEPPRGTPAAARPRPRIVTLVVALVGYATAAIVLLRQFTPVDVSGAWVPALAVIAAGAALVALGLAGLVRRR